MTDKKKIEILEKENAKLRQELEQVRYLTSDGITEYVDDYERANRELFIELGELRENYRRTSVEAGKMLEELREIGKIEGIGKRKFGRRWRKRRFWRR